MPEPGEPLLDVARGDAARSARLRQSLTALRDHTDDPRFRTLLDDVLAGKKGLRAAALSEAFGQGIAANLSQGIARYQALSEEERAAAADEGERAVDQLRDGEPPEADKDGEDGEQGPPIPMQDAW